MSADRNKRWAVVFPGQGAQQVGMCVDAATTFPNIRVRFDEASAILGADLWQTVSDGPKETLDQTIITQPVLYVAGVALYETLQSLCGVTPVAVAGHSLGEYCALTVSGALPFSAGVALVRARAEAMQQAVPVGSGAMAAVIGLDVERIAAVCDAVEGIVSPANLNAPEQTVIAGENDAVDRAIDALEDIGAKRVIPLAVSIPSHCALMQPAADRLRAALNAVSLAPPRLRCYSNVSAAPYSDIDSIRAGLYAQLFSPVRWFEIAAQLHAEATHVIECGPGKVLTNLARRSSKTIQALSCHSSDELRAVAEIYLQDNA